MPPPVKHPLAYATRVEEANPVVLDVIYGAIPNDLYGYVFFNSPCGTVNSEDVTGQGLPFPRFINGNLNSEYGSPIFNGDAMLLRFDLTQAGQISFRSRMLRPPCWYADEATRMGNPNGYDWKKWGFKMLGIGRTSFRLGARNQLNTAVNPVIFPGDQHVRMTANFDMGRPWEIDTVSMDLKTAVGSTKDWKGEIPSIASYPFQLYQSTAHPCFDPQTQEFFTVNYTKTFETMFLYQEFANQMFNFPDIVEEQLEIYITQLHAELSSQGQLGQDHSDLINEFYNNINNYIDIPAGIGHVASFLGRLWKRIKRAFLRIGDFLLGMKNRIFLLRWTGDVSVDRWLVLDAATGKPAKINQCMHQNNLSEDYIVLSDSAFKFAADIMISNPFPNNPNLDRMLRDLTSIPQLPRTPLYIIRRSELVNAPRRYFLFGPRIVYGRKVVIDLETVHYSIDYRNPNDQITLHTAHNAASCAAEWIRHYDELATPNKGPLGTDAIHENTVGLMTCGQMDIGRIGKFVIDATSGAILADPKIHRSGTETNVPSPGAHTWAIALHTHRDIISATDVVPQIHHIYWQSYGTDPRFLTKFIEKLYTPYVHRIINASQMTIPHNDNWYPYCLSQQNTATMELEDHYLFQKNELLRSIQFIPRQRENPLPTAPEQQKDGYILCTMLVGPSYHMESDEFSREIWLFDAADLAAGPVCKLSHPKLGFAFTIHSAWIEACVSQPNTPKIPVQQDLQRIINKMWFSGKRQEFTQFMQQHVYPNF